MSRIPEDEIIHLKREVNLADLCRDYGIELKQTGPDNLMGLCPFHDDREPSFGVTPSKNLWNCLAGCGGGDTIQLVMKKESVSFRHAVEVLRRRMGTAPAAAVLTTRRGTAHPVLIEPGTELTDALLLSRVTDFYHQTLLNTSRGMKYLQERKIFSPEAINTFRLGMSDRTLGYRIPEQTAHGIKLKAHLQKIGIMRDSGHEHFTGCVVFPILDDAGNVVEIYGRRTTSTSRESPKHLYLPGPHAGVWNAGGVKDSKEWLLCEALIDALSLWVNGYKNVTASYGVNGFTQDHWKLLRACKPERVLICYDNDDGGNRAANELAQQLEPEGIEAWRIELAARSDVNDLVRASDDAPSALASLLAASRRLLPTQRPAVVRVPPLPSLPSPAIPISSTAPVELGPAVVAAAAPNESSSESAPPASPAPAVAPGGAVFELLHEGKQAQLTIGAGESARMYRVRGLDHNGGFEQLKVNLRVGCRERFHLDTLDLYQARQRTAFTAAAHQVLALPRETLESDLNHLVVRLEKLQEERLLASLKVQDTRPTMTPEEEAKALALLREPNLFERILGDFSLAGVVGEDANKLMGYLIAVSRKLPKPLSGQIMARSAAGKSSLLGSILDFVPPEDKHVVTAMTGQALYYLPEDGLQHKVLAVVEDEGSEQASYPLKILQSEHELVLAVTVRDPEGGMPQTKMKRVKGPVAQFTTSTRPETDYELANRYLVLSVDEGREQTRRIHAAQREAETLRGMLRSMDREEVLKTHHNAQRLLRPLRVNNPLAEQLSFPDDRLRLRRDHQKYLGLIRTVAFLRQYQKPIRSCEHRGQTIQYVEVDETDLALTHKLAAEVLGRSLDELAPPTRSFLLALHEMVRAIAAAESIPIESVRFTRRLARERTGWGVTQVREHLEKLLELEYAVCHRVPGQACRFEYELAWDGQGQDGQRFVNGLTALPAADTAPAPAGEIFPDLIGVAAQTLAAVG
jgi:DNA primase catalytic core